jgi:hypothetical protein
MRILGWTETILPTYININRFMYTAHNTCYVHISSTMGTGSFPGGKAAGAWC